MNNTDNQTRMSANPKNIPISSNAPFQINNNNNGNNNINNPIPANQLQQQPGYQGGQYSDLRRENDQLKAENRNLRGNITQLEAFSRQKDQQLYKQETDFQNLKFQHAKEIETLRNSLGNVNSDIINYKEMKELLEDEIEKIKSQRQIQLQNHAAEMNGMRERQKSLLEDQQEQKRKFENLHFFLERNAKQFQFEEEQLKSQLKIKDQEIINLEKQLKLTQPGILKEQASNLVQENENLRQRMSEMAKQLSQYSELESRIRDNAQLKQESDIVAIENRLKIEQERVIRQKTIEIETNLTRLNQENAFSKQREDILNQNISQLQEQNKQMAINVSQSVEEIRQWKEKYQQVLNQKGQPNEIIQLTNELKNKDNLIKQQEEQMFRLTQELHNHKLELDNQRSNGNPAQVQQLQRIASDQQNQIEQLSSELEDVRKKSKNQQPTPINVYQQAPGNDDFQVRLLEGKNKQLALTIVELESKLAKYGDTPAQLGRPSSYQQYQGQQIQQPQEILQRSTYPQAEYNIIPTVNAPIQQQQNVITFSPNNNANGLYDTPYQISSQVLEQSQAQRISMTPQILLNNEIRKNPGDYARIDEIKTRSTYSYPIGNNKPEPQQNVRNSYGVPTYQPMIIQQN